MLVASGYITPRKSRYHRFKSINVVTGISTTWTGLNHFLQLCAHIWQIFFTSTTPHQAGLLNKPDIHHMITHVHVYTSHLYRDRRWRVIARVKGQSPSLAPRRVLFAMPAGLNNL